MIQTYRRLGKNKESGHDSQGRPRLHVGTGHEPGTVAHGQVDRADRRDQRHDAIDAAFPHGGRSGFSIAFMGCQRHGCFCKDCCWYEEFCWLCSLV